MSKKLVVLVLFSLIFSASAPCATEEEMAQTAEQAGKPREALTHYVSALGSVPEGSADDERLREKIILLAQKLDPPPAISEEAERYMGHGKAAFKIAENPSDIQAAAQGFQKASDLAPWWADAYFNLALAYEQGKKYKEAIFNLKLYLLAAPSDPDAKKIKEKIYELDFLAERGEAKEKNEEQQKARIDSILGTWNLEFYQPPGPGMDSGRSWGTAAFTRQGDVIEVHGTTTRFQVANLPMAYDQNPRPYLLLRGTLQGPGLENIKWERWRELDSNTKSFCPQIESFQKVDVSLSADLRQFSFRFPMGYYDSDKGMCVEYESEYTLTRGT